ncbi:uncharacterized protein LOC124168894 [Ischnura elegans]|uniref:uncharacterized protein LOC124161875 n=1 Tax=Ischnura elegans TaxID=197161 RepID=UPI001ED8AAAD|nr:uncharacterized protein LOC124161875 [Ischnura elegans]XP_046403229.1 uncharacterized protein LOC124168894 [Ischnura elegans]
MGELLTHGCFLGRKQIFLEENTNILFFPEEEVSALTPLPHVEGEKADTAQECQVTDKFDWPEPAVLALITAYEAKSDELNSVKKRPKFWENLSAQMSDLGHKVTASQARNKFNNLLARYKKCVDNMGPHASGRAPMRFKYFDQFQEIFGHRNNVCSSYVGGSSLMANPIRSAKATNVPLTSLEPRLPSSHIAVEPGTSALTKEMLSTNAEGGERARTNVVDVMKKKPPHGSGTKAARTRSQLEQQWLHHLKRCEEKDDRQKVINEQLMMIQRERMELKKKKLEIWEAMVEEKRLNEQRKEDERRDRHRERMQVEREKIRLLQNLLTKKGSLNSND